MKTRLIFTGGGTGGHIYPNLAIIRELKKQLPDLEVHFIAPREKDLKEIGEKEEVVTKKIISAKLHRYFTLKNLIIPFNLSIGLAQALIYLSQIKPRAVFLKGGYGSLPVGLAALMLKIDIFLHESDTYPGLITRVFSKWAKLSFISFKETKNYIKTTKVKLTGNPIRCFNYSGDNSQAKEALGVNKNQKMILILGGSQGSKEINELVLNTASSLLVNFSLVHVVGKKKFNQFKEKVKKNINKKSYKVYPYLNEDKLSQCYKAADLIISRSGSSLIFEIAQAGKASILIPLIGAAADHQRKNAYAYMKTGACLVIEQPNLKQNIFLEDIKKLLKDKDKIEKMEKSARGFALKDAAKDISRLILKNIS